jgi:hypothetical protein
MAQLVHEVPQVFKANQADEVKLVQWDDQVTTDDQVLWDPTVNKVLWDPQVNPA